MKTYTITCSNCGLERTLSLANRSRDKDTLCRSCSKKGNKNPFYGDSNHGKKMKASVLKIGHGKWSEEKRKSRSQNIMEDGVLRTKLGNHRPSRYWLGKSRSEETKQKIQQSKLGTHWGVHSEEAKQKIREKLLDRIQNLTGKIVPFYNPNACKLFEEINRELNWNGQHAENGGEVRVGGYFLDYYEPNLNIAIEYDEAHHRLPKQITRDIQKENYIKAKMNCKFYRIEASKEGEWKTILCQI